MGSRSLPLWEVFVRPRDGLSHRHSGSLHASDAESALSAARDVYARRNEGTSIWVVRSEDVTASPPSRKAENFTSAESKTYRHAGFYEIPPEAKNI